MKIELGFLPEANPRIMTDRLTGITLFLSSLVMTFLSWQLPLGRLSRPGPGMYPLLLALILGVLSFILFLRPSQRRPSGEAEEERGRRKTKVVYVLGVLLIYAFFFPLLGYLLSTFLFLLLLKPVIEKKWSFVLAGALLVTLASYLVFDILLQAQLPRGIWGM